MKNLRSKCILIVLSVLAFSASAQNCRHYEFAELQQMSVAELKAECIINNLHTNILEANKAKEHELTGYALRNNLSREAREHAAIRDAIDPEISKCNDEQTRIKRILIKRKAKLDDECSRVR